MSVELNQIAANRYAPAGSQAINLYSTETASGLTLAQRIAPASIRHAGALEEQSITKMNIMSFSTEMLDKASVFMQQLAEGTMSNWAEAKAYLTDTVGVAGLSDDISTYDKRMQAVNAIKERLDVLTQQAQEDMIDMQTLINRRDMTFNTSSNVVKSIGNSKLNSASKMA